MSSVNGSQIPYRRFLQVVAAFVCLVLSSMLAAKSVVVVDSYNAGYPWSDTSRQGFIENIDEKHHVTFLEMDTKRIESDLYEGKANLIWQEIIKRNPDIVVTMDDNALKYLGQKITDTGFPLVFMGVNNDPRLYFRDGKLPEKISGVLERPLLFQSMSYISKLLPMKLNRILLMMDSGATSTGFYDKTLEGHDKIRSDGIDLEVFMTDSFGGWQTKIRSLSQGDYDAILIGSFSTLQDQATPDVTDAYILEWASIHSPIPLFTFWSHRVGPGKTIGGLVISGYEQGKSAALKANTILERDFYPLVEVSKVGDPIFSRSQLERWSIRLPGYIKKRSQIVE